MDYALRQAPGVVTVVVLGQFTIKDHETFKEIIHLTRNSDLRCIDINLGGVSFIDSSAMGMLLLLKEAATQRNINVRLHSPQKQLKKIFEICRFYKLFEIVP